MDIKLNRWYVIPVVLLMAAVPKIINMHRLESVLKKSEK